MTARKLFLLAASAAVLVVLFAVLRPDDDGDSAGAGTTAATTTTAATPTTTATATATTTAPTTAPTTMRRDVVRLLVVVDVNEPTRPRKLKVTEGRRVLLLVRANAVDEVHVHGYDVVRRVAPGSPARLAFDADLAGVFEIELEERHQLIAELEVRP